jgi:hypothetical protein
VSDRQDNSGRRRRSQSLQYKSIPLASLPPAEGVSDFSGEHWSDVTRQFERGNACKFTIPPHALVAFWAAAIAHVGPVAIRYNVKHNELFLYPWTDARPFEARADQSVSPAELARLHAQAARLRGDALVRFIMADALRYVADRMRRGLSRADALADFVMSRGAGGYPIGFDGPVFDQWLDTLSADADLAAALGRSPSPAESDRKRPSPNGGKR